MNRRGAPTGKRHARRKDLIRSLLCPLWLVASPPSTAKPRPHPHTHPVPTHPVPTHPGVYAAPTVPVYFSMQTRVHVKSALMQLPQRLVTDPDRQARKVGRCPRDHRNGRTSPSALSDSCERPPATVQATVQHGATWRTIVQHWLYGQTTVYGRQATGQCIGRPIGLWAIGTHSGPGSDPGARAREHQGEGRGLNPPACYACT